MGHDVLKLIRQLSGFYILYTINNMEILWNNIQNQPIYTKSKIKNCTIIIVISNYINNIFGF